MSGSAGLINELQDALERVQAIEERLGENKIEKRLTDLEVRLRDLTNRLNPLLNLLRR
jgi:uncharacterized protein YeeX (DUF496 family)